MSVTPCGACTMDATGRVWMSSDQHYGHRNIIRLSNRPFTDLQHMHEVLINNYNYLVQPEDTCFFLGDFAFGNRKAIAEVVARLNGRKILIRGNHDKCSDQQYLGMGFSLVLNRYNMHIGDHYVYLSHYPYRIKWLKALYLKIIGKGHALRYQDRKPKDVGGWILHGHTHSKEKHGDGWYHVGVDAHDYKPVSIECISRALYERKR